MHLSIEDFAGHHINHVLVLSCRKRMMDNILIVWGDEIKVPFIPYLVHIFVDAMYSLYFLSILSSLLCYPDFQALHHGGQWVIQVSTCCMEPCSGTESKHLSTHQQPSTAIFITAAHSPLKHECIEYDYGTSGSLGKCHVKASADGDGVV